MRNSAPAVAEITLAAVSSTISSSVAWLAGAASSSTTAAVASASQTHAAATFCSSRSRSVSISASSSAILLSASPGPALLGHRGNSKRLPSGLTADTSPVA